jgi:hypothetical protein
MKDLTRGPGGLKRKRVVSVLCRQAARSVKADEEALKKAAPEPKAPTPKRRKLEISSADPKVDEVLEKTLSPSSPSAAGVSEILKVIIEPPPFKLISPLGSELTNLL